MAEEGGTVILEITDSAESKSKEVLRVHTTGLSQATKAPVGVQVSALPSMPGTIYKGKRLIMSFISDAADGIESEESEVKIPVNILNGASHEVEQTRILTLADFVGFTPAGTVDITCAAGIKQRIAYFDAPEDKLLTLAGGQRYHVFIGDDT